MKTFFKLFLVAILLGGWLLASDRCIWSARQGSFAGIPRTEWARPIRPDHQRTAWPGGTPTPTPRIGPHRSGHACGPRPADEGIRPKGFLISHITETGLADAGKATAAPGEVVIKPAPAPRGYKQDKSIFEFPDKK